MKCLTALVLRLLGLGLSHVSAQETPSFDLGDFIRESRIPVWSGYTTLPSLPHRITGAFSLLSLTMRYVAIRLINNS